MSPFALSGKSSFSVVFKFFVVETSNSMTLNPQLWVPLMTLQGARRHLVPFSARRGKGGNLSLSLVPGTMLIFMQSWAMSNTSFSCQIACGHDHFNPGTCTLVFCLNPESTKMKGYFSPCSTDCNPFLNRIYLLQAEFPTSCSGDHRKEMEAI